MGISKWYVRTLCNFCPISNFACICAASSFRSSLDDASASKYYTGVLEVNDQLGPNVSDLILKNLEKILLLCLQRYYE